MFIQEKQLSWDIKVIGMLIWAEASKAISMLIKSASAKPPKGVYTSWSSHINKNRFLPHECLSAEPYETESFWNTILDCGIDEQERGELLSKT